jgi:sulfite oxidase
VLHPGQSVVQGYAYSGGGRGIVRVDVSSDGGNKWMTATLTAGREQPLDRAWAWTFWDCLIDIPEETPADTVIQVM